MTEKPVIFANAIASEPPASSMFPIRPKKSMEMIDFEAISKVVISMGNAVFPRSSSSSTTCMVQGKNGQ